MTLSDVALRDARLITLQGRLLDHTGHVYKGLARDEVSQLIEEINGLRERNGWTTLDMSGRWRPRKYRRPAQ